MTVDVGASIGVAFRPPRLDPQIPAEDLPASADADLYAAKDDRNGRLVTTITIPPTVAASERAPAVNAIPFAGTLATGR